MKHLYILLLLILSIPVHAQVGIDTTTPEGALDIGSTNSGLIYPVVALTALGTETISNPAGGGLVAGTTVYNTSTVEAGGNSIYPGLYFWDGSSWVAQFEKDDNVLFYQTVDLRTGSDDLTYGTLGDQAITFNGSTFTPVFSGPYKVLVTMHYGAGKVNAPDYVNQFSNFATQQGDFDFTLNGTTHTINLSAFSGINNDSYSNGGSLREFYNMYNQITYTVEETFVRGNNYPFTLTFNQEFSDGFEADGDVTVVPAEDGRGYIVSNGSLRCTVEFNYIGN